MKYAIVRIGGKQYKAEEGQELLVDKLANPKKVEADILLYADGDKVKVGKPFVKEAKVSFKILADAEKGEKIDIYKFKAKSRYRRHTGFRPQYTRLQITKIA